MLLKIMKNWCFRGMVTFRCFNPLWHCFSLKLLIDTSGVCFKKALFVPNISVYHKVGSHALPTVDPQVDLSWQFALQRAWESLMQSDKGISLMHGITFFLFSKIHSLWVMLSCNFELIKTATFSSLNVSRFFSQYLISNGIYFLGIQIPFSAWWYKWTDFNYDHHKMCKFIVDVL